MIRAGDERPSGDETVVGFGYKTSWLAVPGAVGGELADALKLTGRVRMDREAAYRRGAFMASPVNGWPLTHGWARVQTGRVVRAYRYDGARGDVALRVGEPTTIEHQLDAGHRALGPPSPGCRRPRKRERPRISPGPLACVHSAGFEPATF
ncbi:hypothetical protein [Streptomyces sp. NPDC088254]|uniref:hypothetical protein n=1 Tax=Streptomyces sp. NPDC088254 TaxID=3365847 RepID=UPI0037F720DE